MFQSGHAMKSWLKTLVLKGKVLGAQPYLRMCLGHGTIVGNLVFSFWLTHLFTVELHRGCTVVSFTLLRPCPTNEMHAVYI